MKILTFNLWFAPHAQAERLAAVIRLLSKDLPDVVGLQEVMPETHTKLSAVLGSRYFISDAPADSAYYTLLLVKKIHTAIMGRIPFRQSVMGRDVLYARIANLVVATTHLESEDHAPVRKAQLHEAKALLDKVPGTDRILMGDFNFDPTRNYRKSTGPLENDNLAKALPDYVDCWSLLNAHDPGYTLDYKRNPWRGDFVIKSQNVFRFDRIMASFHEWRPVSVALWADESIGTSNGSPVFASDHFGVLVEIEPPAAAVSAAAAASAAPSARPPAHKMAHEAALKRLKSSEGPVVDLTQDSDSDDNDELRRAIALSLS